MDYTCKNCGNVFGDHLTVCPSCGTPAEVAPEAAKVVDNAPDAQVQPEVQQAQPEAQQQPYQQQAYQQQAYQQQPYQQQPYQQQAYQQQPYQQQPYQQQAYQQQAYQQQPYQQQAYQQQAYQQQPYQQGYQQTYYNFNPNMAGAPLKSKLVAGLLGIFLGGFGVHNFYLGFTSKAVIQIFVTLITCGLGSIWGLIEGILIIAGSMNTDADGRPLGE